MHKIPVDRDNFEMQLNSDGSAFFEFHLTPEQVAQLQDYLERVDYEPRTSIVIDNPAEDSTNES
jgi:hypothetical protein